jgi:hypothetical protein
MRQTTNCIWKGYWRNHGILNELKTVSMTIVWIKRRNICHIERMQRDRLPKLMMKNRTTGKRNQG